MSADPPETDVAVPHDVSPARVLVASDFHLGAGWDAVTNTAISTENFLADDAFARRFEEVLRKHNASDYVQS